MGLFYLGMKLLNILLLKEYLVVLHFFFKKKKKINLFCLKFKMLHSLKEQKKKKTEMLKKQPSHK